MGGGAKQTTNSSQSSTTTPWSAAMPLLNKVISGFGGVDTGVTPAQTAAVNRLTGEASGIPQFDTSTPITNLLTSTTAPQVGMLTNSLNSLQTSLSPIASGSLDPYQTPGFSDALGRMTQDITNSVKGVYAGSGRDPSGAGSFAGSLARGLTQGEAPVIAGQYNANVANRQNAATSLASGIQSGAGAITGQEQVPLTNEEQAIGLIPSAATAATTPGSAGLAAANTAYGLPISNLSPILQAALGLGSMGQQSEGHGTQTTEQSGSTFSNILGGIMGGTGILSQMGAFGPAGFLLASDKRIKEGVEEIGKLHDGETKVYRFRFKGDPTMRVGLLAQEVAKTKPEAVQKLPQFGILAVDHKLATDRAAQRAAA